ncbi:MAG: hypothetical protein ACMUIG_08895 [Thermoplasmatota archaeon]
MNIWKNALVFGILATLFSIPLTLEVSSEEVEYEMDTDLGESFASFIGEFPGDYSGYSISDAGDVNGDGYDDFLIGAPYNYEGGYTPGQTYLILGGRKDLKMDMNLSKADASFLGEGTADLSGICVSSAGDVNGDGFDDFLIGASNNNENGYSSGQVYLIMGKKNGWAMDTSLKNADASFHGEAEWDKAGSSSLDGVGDVNGDGYDDFMIGVPYNDEHGSESGQAYLILGKKTGWSMDVNLSIADASFRGMHSGDRAGRVLSGAGDFNGDGLDDMIIGAPKGNYLKSLDGLVHIIFGNESGWAMDVNLSEADVTFHGECEYDLAPYSVDGAGDVNGDGLDDIIIGVIDNEQNGKRAGKTYLIHGNEGCWFGYRNLSVSNASFLGETEFDFSGACVAGVGDTNNDGFDDFVIGADGNDENGENSGQSYLIYGNSTSWFKNVYLSSTDASFIGEAADDRAGSVVSGAGDVNGDGCDDIIIGSYLNDENGQYSGQTYLIQSYFDDDFDGVENAFDEFPNNPFEFMDTDGDGIGDNLDPDMDGDGIEDLRDMFPMNSSEWLDSDLDGNGNNNDTDDDNDGIPDILDKEPLNPLNGIRDDIAHINSTLIDSVELEELLDVLDMIKLSIYETEGNITGTIYALNSVIVSSLEGMNTTMREILITDFNAAFSDFDKILNNITDLGIGINDSLDILLRDIQTDIDELGVEIGIDIDDIGVDIGSDIDELSVEIGSDIETLNTYIQLRMDQLSLLMIAVNTSLQNRLSTVEAELSSIKSDLKTNLMGISESLDELSAKEDKDTNKIVASISSVNSLMYDLNNRTTKEIENQLLSIRESISELNSTDRIIKNIDKILDKVDVSMDNLSTEFQGIDEDLQRLAEIEGIIKDLEVIENNIEKGDEDTRSDNQTNRTLLIMIIILLVIIICLISFIIYREFREIKLKWD